jgi:hypothetical protein
LPLKGTNHSSEQKERIRTETGTFRIDQDILNELRSEAKQKHESLNVVINNVLEFYVNYYVPLRKARYIHFSIDLLARIFNNLNDEQIHKIAEEYVKYEFKQELLMLGRDYTLLSFMDAVCSWCEASGFPYRYDKTNDADIYIIRFDLGEKWPIFFGKYIQAIAEHFKVKNLEAEVTNNTVMFKIQRT